MANKVKFYLGDASTNKNTNLSINGGIYFLKDKQMGKIKLGDSTNGGYNFSSNVYDIEYHKTSKYYAEQQNSAQAISINEPVILSNEQDIMPLAAVTSTTTTQSPTVTTTTTTQPQKPPYEDHEWSTEWEDSTLYDTEANAEKMHSLKVLGSGDDCSWIELPNPNYMHYVDDKINQLDASISSLSQSANTVIQKVTQSQYDALTQKSDNVLYCIVE